MREPHEEAHLHVVQFFCEGCRRPLGAALCFEDAEGYGMCDADRHRRIRHLPVGVTDPIGTPPLPSGWHGPKTGAARLWAEGEYLYWQCGCGAPLRQLIDSLFRHVLEAEQSPVKWTLKRASHRRFAAGARLEGR